MVSDSTLGQTALRDGLAVPLPATGSGPPVSHVFTQEMVDAVELAMACQRPLLVRGEPGLGKTQLAYAIAEHLEREPLSFVMDAHTESRDLLYHVDAVGRLAEAQLYASARIDIQALREHTDRRKFLEPGPMWWALHWDSAAAALAHRGAAPPRTRAGWRKEQGCVVLLDEIDKADAAVPNGLLEVLGQRSFRVLGERVERDPAQPLPIVVCTTNEERTLPDAFIRRCVVLLLEFPTDRVTTKLDDLARAHGVSLPPKVIERVIERLLAERKAPREAGERAPAFAEYLDLLRALQAKQDKSGLSAEEGVALVERLAPFVFAKHRRPREPTEP